MDEASQLIRKEPVVLNDLIAETAADMELQPGRTAAARERRFPPAGRGRGQPLAAGVGVPQPRGQRRRLLGRARHLHPPRGRHARGVHDALRRQRHRRRTKSTCRTCSNASTASTRGARANSAARGWGWRSSRTPWRSTAARSRSATATAGGLEFRLHAEKTRLTRFISQDLQHPRNTICNIRFGPLRRTRNQTG